MKYLKIHQNTDLVHNISSYHVVLRSSTTTVHTMHVIKNHVARTSETVSATALEGLNNAPVHQGNKAVELFFEALNSKVCFGLDSPQPTHTHFPLKANTWIDLGLIACFGVEPSTYLLYAM